MTYQMICSCGDTMSVEAGSREEAVKEMKAMMNQDAIDAHVAEKHPGETMTVTEVHRAIDESLEPALVV